MILSVLLKTLESRILLILLEIPLGLGLTVVETIFVSHRPKEVLKDPPTL